MATPAFTDGKIVCVRKRVLLCSDELIWHVIIVKITDPDKRRR